MCPLSDTLAVPQYITVHQLWRCGRWRRRFCATSVFGSTERPPCPLSLSPSTSPGDQPGVGATNKVNPGFLFPLPRHILFIERPPLCIPHSAVSGLEFARPASSTFDMVLHLKKPPNGGSGGGGGAAVVVELSQIDRNELGRLQAYAQRCRIKVRVWVGWGWGGRRAGGGPVVGGDGHVWRVGGRGRPMAGTRDGACAFFLS